MHNIVTLNNIVFMCDLFLLKYFLLMQEWSFRNSSSKSLGMLLCETFSDHFEGEPRQTTLGPEGMLRRKNIKL